jgi:site-specific recombinase XerD
LSICTAISVPVHRLLRATATPFGCYSSFSDSGWALNRQHCASRISIFRLSCLSLSLEQERHNSVRSRNVRLAAIRSFFRLVALRDPASVELATRVLAIPVKRTDRRLVGLLSRAEIEALLTAPDLTQWQGRRDYALLLTLYNSGARVSEMMALQQHRIHFGASTFLHLRGERSQGTHCAVMAEDRTRAQRLVPGTGRKSAYPGISQCAGKTTLAQRS